MTALRSLLAEHDVTWIASAMTDEDRAVAAEAGGEAIEETLARRGALPVAAGRPRRGGVRLVLQRHLEPDAVVPAALPLGLAYAPSLDPALHHAWEEGYVAVNAGFAERGARGARRASPTARCSSTTTTSTWLRAWCGSERPDTAIAHFVHIPWPQPDYWHVLPSPIRRAIHDGLLACDLVGFHTGVGGGTSCAPAPTSSGPTSTSRRHGRLRRSLTRVVASRCRWTRRSSMSSRASDTVLALERRAGGHAPRVPRAPRRPDRSLEERRPRVPRVRALPRRAPRAARARRACSPCSTLRARTSPSTPSTWVRSSGRPAR